MTRPTLTAPSARTIRRLLVLLLGVVVIAAGSLIHPPYVLMRPGPVYDTLGDLDGKPVIDVKGAQSYPTDGQLDFTTVAVYGGPSREINVWDLLIAKLQPSTEIRPMDEVYQPNVTRDQIREETQAQMTDAQAEAKVVALRATGLTVPERVTVASVLAGGPAEGVLQKGDRFVSLAGVPVTSATALRATIQGAAEGAKLAAVVHRGDADVPVQLGTAVRDGRRMLGIGLAVGFDFPVDVQINAGDIGGPSAGLMFTLGVYDKLTPGSLTGGKKIAGTGTMSDDGTVGAIGGIQHKMRGARDSQHVDWFLAPADNCKDVTGNVPDGLNVVKVATFDEARHDVEEIAAGRGAALPRC